MAAHVAFKPRESPDLGDRGGTASLAELPPPQRPVPARDRVDGRVEPPGVTRVRLTPPRSAHRRSRPRRTEVAARRPRPRVPRPSPTTPPPPPPPPATPPPEPPPQPTIVRGHLEAVAAQTRATGKQAAAVASQVSPDAGRLVEHGTDAAATAVEDVASYLP